MVATWQPPTCWVGADEAHHEVQVQLSCSSHSSCVIASSQCALAAHLCQQQAAPTLGQANGLKAVDDAWPRHQVCVGDVGPVGNVVDATSVLAHHSVANVSKLAVLKDQEVVLL